MGAYIARQPNGLLCRFSTVVDCPTDDNMTDEDYIELCAERARDEAKRNLMNPNFVRPFEYVKEDFYPSNMSVDKFREWLRFVGDYEADEFKCSKDYYDEETDSVIEGENFNNC